MSPGEGRAIFPSCILEGGGHFFSPIDFAPKVATSPELELNQGKIVSLMHEILNAEMML